MSFNQAYIKDSLRRIEAKLDQLLESNPNKTITMPEPMSDMQIRMARVRAARKVNTGEGGRG